jgi:hypothetical protein
MNIKGLLQIHNISRKHKKKLSFQFTEWAFRFGIPALNCKALLLGALLVAMLASLVASWWELLPCTWFAEIYLKGTFGAMSLLGNNYLSPFVCCKKWPTFFMSRVLVVILIIRMIFYVTNNACNLHGIRERVRRNPKSLIILLFLCSPTSWDLVKFSPTLKGSSKSALKKTSNSPCKHCVLESLNLESLHLIVRLCYYMDLW